MIRLLRNTSTFLLLFLLISGVTVRTAVSQVRFDRVDSVSLVVGGQVMQNAWAGGINFPLYSSIDLNGDGVKDMVLFDRVNNRLSCYLNDGTPSLAAWKYAPRFESAFPPVNRWLLAYDYNCDGKEDLFTISPQYPSCIACYRNDYTSATGLRFTLVAPVIYETFSTTSFPVFASGVLIPAFDDIDSDGDMDILGYNSIPDGRVILHKNESMELFGTCDSLRFNYANACWGNFAFQVGGANEVGCFNCPCRVSGYLNNVSPVFDTGEARRDDTVTSIFALDVDGNGAKDLLVGDISALTTLMVHNGGTSAVALMDSQDVNYPSNDIPAIINGFHYHAFVDVDNDGRKDLIVSPNEFENKEAQWVYKNNGTSAAPVFNLLTTSFLQDEMLEVGENAAPAVTDIDGDGLPDLVVGGAVYDTANGTYVTSLNYFRNTGSVSAPSYQLVNDDLASISSFAYNTTIFPAFGDLDADGDKDLLLGTEDGKLQYFQNNAGSYLLTAPNYMGIDVGNNCTPQLVDLDRDGKLDIVAGEKNGFINLFKNIGTSASASFLSAPTQDTLGGINLQMTGFADGYAVPFIYDSAGSYRLVASNMAGYVYFYGNIDGNILGRYSLIDSLYDAPRTSRIRFNISVGGGDLNGDGFSDLVIGHASGGVELYYQHDGIASVGEISVVPEIFVYPNPAGDMIHISFKSPAAGTRMLDVTDICGRVLKTMAVTSSETQIPSGELPEGIYFVRVDGAAVRVAVVH
ncbi:MAG: hypothetical protein RL213_1772 [Bacteroidota bacterium]